MVFLSLDSAHIINPAVQAASKSLAQANHLSAWADVGFNFPIDMPGPILYKFAYTCQDGTRLGSCFFKTRVDSPASTTKMNRDLLALTPELIGLVIAEAVELLGIK